MGKYRSYIRGLQVSRAWLGAYARASRTTIVETLWPTRCCLCDAPGDFVCGACRSELAYVDQWQACPRCGAPDGMVQCTECNELSLADVRPDGLPFLACVGAVRFDDDTACIVRTYKDAGERGLSDFMGYAIACAVPPEWVGPDSVVAPVPATRKAFLRRGFDHGLELASSCAEYLGLPCEELLVADHARDQRALGRSARIENASGRFEACRSVEGADVLVVDDVYTTGATSCAASDALLAAGARSVRCATFARVY